MQQNNDTLQNSRFHTDRRTFQNFLLIWIDSNINPTSEDFKTPINHLRKIIATIETYQDVEECLKYLVEIKNEKIFMIVSDTLGQNMISQIELLPQIESIYIFSCDCSYQKELVEKYTKVRGIYKTIQHIGEALQMDREQCDQSLISISYNGIDAIFMYTQLIKEALLQIEDDNVQSIENLIEYCRSRNVIPEEEIQLIEGEYHLHKPIWWYTAPYNIYSTLNRGLREMDGDILLNFGFFIRHLHNYIAEHHYQQQNGLDRIVNHFIVYRGQGLSNESFGKMQKSVGGLMSFNNFLSTSRNRNIALKRFTQPAAVCPNQLGILFVMNIDPEICQNSKSYFMNVNSDGYFKDYEEEILFTTHTVFRIDRVVPIADAQYIDRLWEITLTIMKTDENSEMVKLNAYRREEFQQYHGWNRLGEILIRASYPTQAERLYQGLLKQQCSDEQKGNCFFQLGKTYSFLGDSSRSMDFFQQSLQLREQMLGENHPDVASVYNGIGNVHHDAGKYSEALESFEKSLKIQMAALPWNHPSLAITHNNLGFVYASIGEYMKAFESYERSLEIKTASLPQNHPDIANTHTNIGNLYADMGQYLKALESYERSHEIWTVVLPPNHATLGISYNNIGLIYADIGIYDKAFDSFERSLEIWKVALPPNHPDIGMSYSNIGRVYNSMSQYSEALQSYERSLEIKHLALSSTHPDLALSYNGIGSVYENLQDYCKALEYFEKAQQIWRVYFPSTHPYILHVNSNIERVKSKC